VVQVKVVSLVVISLAATVVVAEKVVEPIWAVVIKVVFPQVQAIILGVDNGCG
jgi:hypothetical protein